MSRSYLSRKLLILGGLGLGALVWALTSSSVVPPVQAATAVVVQPDGGGGYTPATLEQEIVKWSTAGHEYQPASTCADCHKNPKADYFQKKAGFETPAVDLALLTEYSVWKVHDKHAQAYAILLGERGRQMMETLGFSLKGKDEKDYPAVFAKAGCMSCHAMYNLPGAEPGLRVEVTDGVSCGGCHGPSSNWTGDHWQAGKKWRQKTPQQKMDLGMRDLRHPEVRARLCMSCHIGSAPEGKVVSHAMFAAGHPPLPPLEVATFSRNEPQHWRDAKDNPYFKFLKENDPKALSNYDIQNAAFHRTRIAAVGSIVALRETMKLILDRADFDFSAAEERFKEAGSKGDLKIDPLAYWPELAMRREGPIVDKAKLPDEAKKRWPELALSHSDCYACHHDLKYPGFRQGRGFGFHVPGHPVVRVRAGRPMVREWALALIPAANAATGTTGEVKTLMTQLEAFAKVLSVRPFGVPTGTKGAKAQAQAVMDACDKMLLKLRTTTWGQKESEEVLKHLLSLPATKDEYLPDYESARQMISMIKVINEDLVDAGVDKGATSEIKELAAALDTEPYQKYQLKRLELILNNVVLKVLKFDDKTGAEKKAIEDSRDAFIKFIKDGQKDIGVFNPTDPRKNLELQTFFGAIALVNNDDFNKAITSNPVIVKTLQEQGDAMVQGELNAVSNYDPEDFLEKLKVIAEKMK